MSSSTVDIDPALLEQLKKFRLAKRSSGNAAIVIKIDKKKLLMSVEETFDDVSLEELSEGERSSQSWAVIQTHSPQEIINCLTYVDLACATTELPENSPRFIVLSYKLDHKDGRVSFVSGRLLSVDQS